MWVRVVVLGGFFLSLGFLWAFLSAPRVEVRPTPWVLEEAWPKKPEPYVILFTDPLCPFCQRLGEALREDPAMKRFVRYVPVAKHEGSYGAWLLRLRDWGWNEAEARAWLERGIQEAEASGVRLTPVAYTSTGKTIVGFASYPRWKEEVEGALEERSGD